MKHQLTADGSAIRPYLEPICLEMVGRDRRARRFLPAGSELIESNSTTDGPAIGPYLLFLAVFISAQKNASPEGGVESFDCPRIRIGRCS